jgi:hypothetical protein
MQRWQARAEPNTGPGPAQEPPDVTWPEPELDDGAAEDFSPLEPEVLEVEPELPELVLLLGAVLWDVDEEAAGWALAALARPTAMPPPARTLAAPMAAVTARSRPWARFRAAARSVCLPLSTPDRPSAGPCRRMAVPGQDGRLTSARPLLRLRGACELRGCGRGCG